MSVWRTGSLPTGPVRGRLLVTDTVIEHTTRALRVPRWRRGQERLVFWAGREVDDEILVVSCIVPVTTSTPQGVWVDESAVGSVAEAARAARLGVVAQVHTHPGVHTLHSSGDDHLVLLPFEGMFSLVVGQYGRGSVLPSEGGGLHQFQDGRWVHLDADPAPMLIVHELVDVAG